MKFNSVNWIPNPNFKINYNSILKPTDAIFHYLDLYRIDIFPDCNLQMKNIFVNLSQLYKSVSGAIREVDDETVLFWEPTTW